MKNITITKSDLANATFTTFINTDVVKVATLLDNYVEVESTAYSVIDSALNTVLYLITGVEPYEGFAHEFLNEDEFDVTPDEMFGYCWFCLELDTEEQASFLWYFLLNAITEVLDTEEGAEALEVAGYTVTIDL